MILKPQPTAVIFDLDGTLLNSKQAHSEARKLLAKIYWIFGFNLVARCGIKPISN